MYYRILKSSYALATFPRCAERNNVCVSREQRKHPGTKKTARTEYNRKALDSNAKSRGEDAEHNEKVPVSGTKEAPYTSGGSRHSLGGIRLRNPECVYASALPQENVYIPGNKEAQTPGFLTQSRASAGGFDCEIRSRANGRASCPTAPVCTPRVCDLVSRLFFFFFFFVTILAATTSK